jgi:hypothetical protein
MPRGKADFSTMDVNAVGTKNIKDKVVEKNSFESPFSAFDKESNESPGSVFEVGKGFTIEEKSITQVESPVSSFLNPTRGSSFSDKYKEEMKCYNELPDSLVVKEFKDKIVSERSPEAMGIKPKVRQDKTAQNISGNARRRARRSEEKIGDYESRNRKLTKQNIAANEEIGKQSARAVKAETSAKNLVKSNRALKRAGKIGGALAVPALVGTYLYGKHKGSKEKGFDKESGDMVLKYSGMSLDPGSQEAWDEMEKVKAQRAAKKPALILSRSGEMVAPDTLEGRMAINQHSPVTDMRVHSKPKPKSIPKPVTKPIVKPTRAPKGRGKLGKILGAGALIAGGAGIGHIATRDRKNEEYTPIQPMQQMGIKDHVVEKGKSESLKNAAKYIGDKLVGGAGFSAGALATGAAANELGVFDSKKTAPVKLRIVDESKKGKIIKEKPVKKVPK